jgi:hypothetical protein
MDFGVVIEQLAPGIEVRLRFPRPETTEAPEVTIRLERGTATTDTNEIKVASRDILEMAVPLSFLKLAPHEAVRFQVSLWQGGLPLGAVPQQGWIELAPASPEPWPN